jgi:dUTP pyrophosphatase
MIVKVRNTGTNPLPAYATAGSAGMDIAADNAEPLVLQPLQRTLVPTGLYIEIPAGYEMQVRPRSGLALKHGVTILNAPATIDSDYRGELRILLVNLGTEAFTIERGMRIAQLLLAPTTHVEWQPAAELSETGRATGGFGHTGLSS